MRNMPSHEAVTNKIDSGTWVDTQRTWPQYAPCVAQLQRVVELPKQVHL